MKKDHTIHSLERSLAERLVELTASNTDRDRALSAVKDSKREDTRLQTELDKERNNLRAMETKYREEIAELRNQKNKADREREKAEKERDHAVKSMVELRRELLVWKDKFETSQKDLKATQQELAEAIEEIHNLNHDFNTERQQIDDLNNSWEESKRRENALHHKLRAAIEEIEQLKVRLMKVHTGIRELELADHCHSDYGLSRELMLIESESAIVTESNSQE